jgi:hypothetical protein
MVTRSGGNKLTLSSPSAATIRTTAIASTPSINDIHTMSLSSSNSTNAASEGGSGMQQRRSSHHGRRNGNGGHDTNGSTLGNGNGGSNNGASGHAHRSYHRRGRRGPSFHHSGTSGGGNGTTRGRLPKGRTSPLSSVSRIDDAAETPSSSSSVSTPFPSDGDKLDGVMSKEAVVTSHNDDTKLNHNDMPIPIGNIVPTKCAVYGRMYIGVVRCDVGCR